MTMEVDAREAYSWVMAEAIMTEQGPSQERRRAARILARSIFRELRYNGFEITHLVTLTAELLELATDELRVRGLGDAERRGDRVAPDRRHDLAIIAAAMPLRSLGGGTGARAIAAAGERP
jgi:hypothetical protein